MSLLFKPLGIISGLVAGMMARKIFEKGWAAFDGQEPPDAEQREVSIPKLAVALTLEGAIFALVRGLVDHAARRAFASYTGAWPGEERPE